ncbi:MAG: tripartite tricarboxylate transporter substrate binding protein [Xanthobacteraceae bacterium]|jgi:tripartite-type tricarboxylate transporter receptor subunit TctC
MRGVDRRTTLVGLTALLMSQASGRANEDDYPSRDVRIIVSVPAGGGVDLSARIVAGHLQALWGKSFVVENRTGGASNVAADAVAHAEPDGYTLLATPPNVITANAALFKHLTYDPARLEPVAILAMGPNILAVRNDLPIRNVAELVVYAKTNPNKLSYASQGIGSTSHLTMELFKRKTGTELVHVPYRGAEPAVTDLAGGHVDVMFCDLGTVMPLYRSGNISIIAVATQNRVALLPEVPTVDESGVKDFTSTTFYSLMAPPKTPAVIRNKLNRAIVAAMQEPETQGKLKAIFVESSTLDTAAMGKFIDEQATLWAGIVRSAGISIQE